MRKTMLFCLVSVAGFVTSGAAFAQAAADPAPAAAVPASAPSGPMRIFANALGDGWQNKSSATVDVGVDIGSARKPIRVEAGPGQALILQHPPISPGYRKLAFLIQAAPAGSGDVKIVALSAGQPLNREGKTVALKAGGWTKVEVPLATLGAEGVAFDAISIQNPTAAALPVFYIADVELS